MSFICHANILHSSRKKKADIPGVLGVGDISLFDVEKIGGP
jgi:hypothetical protein